PYAPCNIRSSPRKRGPRSRIASRRLWIPGISAFTRVFDALCAGMSGRGARTGFALTLLDQFRLDLGGKIDRAAAADVVEMGIEETPGRPLAELAQRLEIFVVGLERAARTVGFAQILHHDAMEPEPAEFARPHAARQSSFVDEPIDEGDPAQLG